MHRCKISLVWSAVTVIKFFKKDKMSIFWPSSMFIGDGSERFRRIPAYQGSSYAFSKAYLLEEISHNLIGHEWNIPQMELCFFGLLDLGRSLANLVCPKRLIIRWAVILWIYHTEFLDAICCCACCMSTLVVDDEERGMLARVLRWLYSYGAPLICYDPSSMK